jgi:hypothetical protein
MELGLARVAPVHLRQHFFDSRSNVFHQRLRP